MLPRRCPSTAQARQSRALIIVNTDFCSSAGDVVLGTRRGAKREAEKLSEALSELNYKVKLMHNSTAKEMEDLYQQGTRPRSTTTLPRAQPVPNPHLCLCPAWSEHPVTARVAAQRQLGTLPRARPRPFRVTPPRGSDLGRQRSAQHPAAPNWAMAGGAEVRLCPRRVQPRARGILCEHHLQPRGGGGRIRL